MVLQDFAPLGPLFKRNWIYSVKVNWDYGLVRAAIAGYWVWGQRTLRGRFFFLRLKLATRQTGWNHWFVVLKVSGYRSQLADFGGFETDKRPEMAEVRNVKELEEWGRSGGIIVSEILGYRWPEKIVKSFLLKIILFLSPIIFTWNWARLRKK